MDTLLAHLLEAASRAPSAHNTQPWRLSWLSDELQVFVPEDRMLAAADPNGFDTLHAIGTLVENLLLTLRQLGLEGEYETAEHWDLKQPIIQLRWRTRPGLKPDPTLYRMIPIRRTSRRPYCPDVVSPHALAEIRAAAAFPSKLYVLIDPEAIAEIRSLAAKTGALSLQDGNYTAELYRWLRFSRSDSPWYRDGLNAECMGWNALEARLARQFLKPKVATVLAKSRWTRWLYANIEEQAPFAPVLCLLTSADCSFVGHLNAGRNLQRVWLTAAAHGLATHPLSAAVDHPTSRGRVFELFGVRPREVHINLFRLGKSEETVRSPRLPADELLETYV